MCCYPCSLAGVRSSTPHGVATQSPKGVSRATGATTVLAYTIAKARAAPGLSGVDEEVAMAAQIDEAARAELAYAFLKKHFARAGVEIQRDKLPTSWFGFTMLLCDNVEPLIRQGGHDAMLRGLFAEVIGLTAGFSGE